MQWDAISGTIEEDGLSARQRGISNPFKVKMIQGKDKEEFQTPLR